MIELFKTIFQNKSKILILGFGKEGKSTYTFLRKHFNELFITIADQNTKITNDPTLFGDNNLEIITGDKYLNSLDNYDLIIKSPGVKIRNISNDLKVKITSQTDLFLQCYANQTIGVTGTKGKSTTVSLIKHFIKSDNKKVLLLGNIGTPAFDMVKSIEKETVIIYELSAHQLEYINQSPHIAILLNIFPEHLDYFNNYDDYKSAKINIFKYQKDNDTLIISDVLYNEYVGNQKDTVHRLLTIISNAESKYQIKNNPLIGEHNHTNTIIALEAAAKVGVNTDIAIESLITFKTLPHRLEYIGEFEGIKFVNDSISTVPQSTIAAVKSINGISTLILGGYDRGLDYEELVDFLVKSNIKNFIFLGKAGNRMYNLFQDNSSKKLIKVSSIESAFKEIVNITRKGHICILSPAAASYDQYRNFEHRGDVFKSLIK